MGVVQDPKAEAEDKVAGLELLRALLPFDDQVTLAPTRGRGRDARLPGCPMECGASHRPTP